jgi:multidrug efflux system membrane fusion protein
VYVVKPDDTVELRLVEIGPSEGAETVVESGLSAGDIVATDGIDKLQAGTKVATREKSKEKGGRGGGLAAEPANEAGEKAAQ